jgi:hypothetical protein
MQFTMPLTQFWAGSEYFEEIPAIKIHELRYSGQPDPRDTQMPHYVTNRVMMRGYREARIVAEEKPGSWATALGLRW